MEGDGEGDEGTNINASILQLLEQKETERSKYFFSYPGLDLASKIVLTITLIVQWIFLD